ncbi:hypothetical protein EDD29_3672 [Actinocorallia herbida]|uniref:Uncharacterized protein n=1 Tax=Actinocorallia herbida TaxID=58109 RepID=A0A3N1CXT6_9ACTN|nr:hypothetical protein [Actinocorallia herbida]ROO86109.1 hypothetical protein EDD29_3672 [Actinocorallia herbida]
MAEILVVPVRLDALFLAIDTPAVGAHADFGLLPHVDPDTGRDVHPQSPYLGERVTARPFQDGDFRLAAGLHLHWTLPDGLTRHVQRDGETSVPTVPNRWLVTRTRRGRVDAQWVVDSDLFDDAGDGVTYPVTGSEAGGLPFRRLGRKTPLSQWRESGGGDRVRPLTAVGYGEPAFAAFYPDCRSVFGFHDPAITGLSPEALLSYDVVGWYADPRQDPVTALTGTDWRDRLATDLGWSVHPAAPRPTRTVCSARVVFRPDVDPVSPLRTGDSGVCVGLSPTEALAAHLGETLAGTALPGVTADEVEELLESLSFAAELESRPLDAGPALAAARHAAGFRAVPSGTLWTVRRADGPAEPAVRQRREALRLPHAIGDLLDGLNAAQEAYDRAGQELRSRRERLFMDWHRYQLCAYPPDTARDSYPDPDEVRFFLEREIASLADRAARTGRGPEAAPGTLAGALAAARAALLAALSVVNAAEARPVAAEFVLARVPAPGHHVPAEPVVLLTGDAATPSDRHGRDGADRPDGLLACRTARVDDFTNLTLLRHPVAAPSPRDTVWTHAPWHPVLLEWEAEFFPVGPGGNLDGGLRDYDPAYLTANHTLGDVDLHVRPGHGTPVKAANVYSGSTVLSPGPRPVLSARVLRYLSGTILAPYTEATGAATAPEEFLRSPGAVLDWYAAHGPDRRLRTLVAIHAHLSEHEHDNLAQVLGGFNDALLMRRLTRQLPVADPLGFPDHRRFAAAVAEAVGPDALHAPHPLGDFTPIRTGALRIRRLRIIDNFGIPHEVDTEQITTSTRLRVPDRPGWAALPPRLAQPARLAFRWLDADHDLREMNDVPTTSPVCGWVMPDGLDDALAFFAADGTPLGSLVAAPGPGPAPWLPAPGGDTPTADAIAHPRLRAVAAALRDAGRERLGVLLGDLDALLAGVEPADYLQGPLTATALAVVRAELDLQLMGLPAVHQDWNVFRQDLRRAERETTGFPLVRFPVRVGSAARLDDGLVAYWAEDPEHAPGLGEIRLADEAPLLETAPGLPPRRLTMLVDPRAPVHLTSGVLPVKALRIPAAHYRDVLAGLRPVHFVAPVLDDGPGTAALPVPAEPGRTWTWRERERSGWSAHKVTGGPPTADFPAEPTLREGWLTLDPVTE